MRIIPIAMLIFQVLYSGLVASHVVVYLGQGWGVYLYRG